MMKLLLAQDDIQVNLKDKYSHSPLSYAAKNGHLEAVKLLMARDDIEVNLKGKHGGSPLSYAA
jgi:ankyrin repeat protein